MKRVVISSVIETETEEKIIFEAFKKWMIDNFQNFRISISGKEKTLNYQIGKKEVDK